VPEGYLTVNDLLKRMFLRATGLLTASGNADHQWLLQELNAGLMAARTGMGLSSSRGEWVTPSRFHLNTERHARDALRQKLVGIWQDAKVRLWKLWSDGTLPIKIMLDDGQVTDVAPEALNGNVAFQVFETKRLSWPVRGLLIAAEADFERSIGSPGKGSRGTQGAETRTKQWLAEKMRNNLKAPERNSELLKVAQKQFGVSQRGFARAKSAAVAETGAVDWAKGGAKPKT
jgi:hypothetical protein